MTYAIVWTFFSLSTPLEVGQVNAIGQMCEARTKRCCICNLVALPNCCSEEHKFTHPEFGSCSSLKIVKENQSPYPVVRAFREAAPFIDLVPYRLLVAPVCRPPVK